MEIKKLINPIIAFAFVSGIMSALIWLFFYVMGNQFLSYETDCISCLYTPEKLLFYRVLGFIGIIIPLILIGLYIRRLVKKSKQGRKD